MTWSWAWSPSRRTVAASVCESWPQSGAFSLTPCHVTGWCRSISLQRHAGPLDRQIATDAKRDQLLREPVYVGVRAARDPSRTSVVSSLMAVGVVVAALRAPDLVAHQQHRRPHGEHRQRQEVLHLAVAQPFHGRIVGRSFDATVPAQVVGGAVEIAVTVRLVVLGVVGDEVVQREAVVAGDEVDALLRLALLVPVHVGAAGQPVRQGRHGSGVALQESPDVVAKLAVPFLPAVAEEASRPGRGRRRPTLPRSA